MIKTKILHKEGVNNRPDFITANNLFCDLVNYMNSKDIQTEIKKKHKINAKSGDIQNIILNKTESLGFKSEKKGLFNNLDVKQLRPDYYLYLDNNSGIILEVERGKTIANNMDLLDIWKCHICENANILFLIVPNIRQKSNGGEDKIFESVVRRLNAFFEKKNYINVDSVFLIAY
ncbi:MAG: hypothetical protein ACRCZY_05530 [Phocaeicola sp.]